MTRPNDRVASTCGNCAERGRLLAFCAECLLHGGIGGRGRVCDDYLNRKNVIDCPNCFSTAYFVEMKNSSGELTGTGYYYCRNESCKWTSGDIMIPPKGVIKK